MNGPCAKVNLVLSEEPRVNGMPGDWTRSQRALFTLVPSLQFAERCYDIAKVGEMPEELWVDCVVASNADDSLAPPGKHVMTCFVQYVPYQLRQGTWDEKRELLGDRVVRKIAESQATTCVPLEPRPRGRHALTLLKWCELLLRDRDERVARERAGAELARGIDGHA